MLMNRDGLYMNKLKDASLISHMRQIYRICLYFVRNLGLDDICSF